MLGSGICLALLFSFVVSWLESFWWVDSLCFVCLKCKMQPSFCWFCFKFFGPSFSPCSDLRIVVFTSALLPVSSARTRLALFLFCYFVGWKSTKCCPLFRECALFVSSCEVLLRLPCYFALRLVSTMCLLLPWYPMFASVWCVTRSERFPLNSRMLEEPSCSWAPAQNLRIFRPVRLRVNWGARLGRVAMATLPTAAFTIGPSLKQTIVSFLETKAPRVCAVAAWNLRWLGQRGSGENSWFSEIKCGM